MVRHLSILFSVLIFMVAAGPAAAQTSVTQGYDETGVLGNIDETPEVIPGDDDTPSGETIPDTGDQVTPPTTTREAGADVPSGQLPFTGFEAGLILLAGMALLGTGVVLRRTQRDDA